jgi:hypothetical protein
MCILLWESSYSIVPRSCTFICIQLTEIYGHIHGLNSRTTITATLVTRRNIPYILFRSDVLRNVSYYGMLGILKMKALSTIFVNPITNKQNKLHGLSPRANYTDRATAACRRSDCQLLRIEGATWSAVFSVFQTGAATFLSSSSSVVLTRLSGLRSRHTTFCFW